jgi:hypothetical protein
MKCIAGTSEVVLAIAKLVHNIEDVPWIVQTFKKYGRIDNSYGDMD